MSHHASEMTEQLRNRFNEILAKNSEVGATGKYPRGKLSPEDEGEIQIAVALDPGTGTVILNLGKPTAWVGFSAEQAFEIGRLLQEKSWEIRGINSVEKCECHAMRKRL